MNNQMGPMSPQPMNQPGPMMPQPPQNPVPMPVVPMANWNMPTVPTMSGAWMGMNNQTPNPQPQPGPMYQNPQSASQSSGPVPAPQGVPFVGRYIEKETDIVPNEIPMDGRIGVFLTRELDAIYLKGWSQNGNISTVRYVVDQSYQGPGTPRVDPRQDEIFARLEKIEKTLAAKPATTSKSKVKENPNDEL